jgi:hypothetical protein
VATTLASNIAFVAIVSNALKLVYNGAYKAISSNSNTA